MIGFLRKWFENLRIKYKLIGAFSFIFLLVMIFIYAYFPYKQKQSVYKEINKRIQTLAETAALGIGIFLQEQTYTAWYEISERLKSEPDFSYILIYDEKMAIISTMPENYQHKTRIPHDYYKPVITDNFIEIRVPITYKEKFRGDIVMGMSLTSVKREIQKINLVSILTLSGIFIIVFFIVMFISDLINKPIQLLLNSVNRIISSGNYSERVDHVSEDEIGVLANRFNEMIGMIEQRDIELNSQYTELQKVTKLKDEFLAVTTHDLRSPLTAITGFAELLLSSNTLSESDKKRVGHIRSSADFLTNMVNEILELSKLESGKADIKLIPVSLKGILESSIRTLQYMALPKDITLQLIDNSNGQIKIMGNWDALLRVANNLISNAIKFTPRDGHITVVLDVLPPGEENGDGFVLFSVTDTGVGIPDDHISSLFDMYSPISKKGTAGEKGTGLGLSITQKLVAKHGGLISVESRIGKGSCFTVKIPALKSSTGNESTN